MACDYLREKAVAREYPPSRSLLRKWRRNGNGPDYIRLNRMVLYSRKALEEFFARHTVTAKA